MIKVLLVDDEKMALNYLQNLIDWEYYDFELTGVTTDTQQALVLFKKCRPDLIITDVKMPGMTGLDLVREIRNIDSKVHILFLSAYKNFDYAKTAIHLGTDDYLIKSDIDEENFLKKMLSIKELINKEKKKNRYTINVILEELFHKNNREEDYENMLEENDYIKLHKKYSYILLAEKDVPSFIEEVIPQNKQMEETYNYEIERICGECLEENNGHVVAFFPADKHSLLVIAELSASIDQGKDQGEILAEVAAQIFDRLVEKTSTGYFVYYSENRMPVKAFGKFYNEHRSFLLQRYVKKQIQVLKFADEEVLQMEGTGIESVSADEMYQNIKDGNQKEIHKYIENMEKAVLMQDFMSYLWYAQNMFRALKRFDGVLCGKKSKRIFLLNEGNTMYDMRSAEAVIAFIVQKIDDISMLSHEQANEIYSESVMKAMDYIRAEYSNDELSAITVSKEVNLSSSWFSTKFKEEVGIGIAEFINSIRVEEAKKMFDSGDYMIYEVSEKTGFTSSQYFSKIFKEYTGITPNQYRKNKKEC